MSEEHQSPECYFQIYMNIIGSQSFEELTKEIKKFTVCLKFLRVNDRFSHMVPTYENELSLLEKRSSGFHLAKIMLPHMMRSARHRIIDINLKEENEGGL